MKKILFVTHTISAGGGSEKVLKTLIEELKGNYEIDILEWLQDSTMPFDSNEPGIKYLDPIALSDNQALKLGENIMINRVKHNLLALMNIFFPKIIYKWHVKKKYDYEISFNYLYSSMLIAHSPNASSKKIMWIHGAIDNLNAKHNIMNLKYLLYKWQQKIAFSKADAIVAISKRTHDSICRFVPEFREQIVDIYNGYDFKEIAYKSNFESPEQTKSVRLISIGRLSEAKNVRMQLDVIKLLNEQGYNIELQILGAGELENEIREFSSSHPYVNLIGYKSNPYPYIAKSDFLLITSFAEGFPTVAVEAMALGKPVISTPVAGTEELINEDTGIIIDWDIENAMGGIIKAINKKFDSQLIKNHVAKYSKEIWARNVVNLLNDLDNEN